MSTIRQRQAIPVIPAPSNRQRVERVTAARVRIEIATAELEGALEELTSTRLGHPVIEELREAILAGRRMLAKTSDLLKRIP